MSDTIVSKSGFKSSCRESVLGRGEEHDLNFNSDIVKLLLQVSAG